MTSVQAVVLSALISVCLATPAVAKEKKPTRSARPAAGKSAERRPQWMEKSDPKGFTLKVPWESTEKRDEWSTSYSVLLAPDSAKLKAVVTVEALDDFTPVTNMEKAVASVTARRPGALKATIAEQRELPDGYLVIVGPDYDIYTVNVIRNGKEIQVKAQCSGPGSRLAVLKEMCLSVKPKK